MLDLHQEQTEEADTLQTRQNIYLYKQTNEGPGVPNIA